MEIREARLRRRQSLEWDRFLKQREHARGGGAFQVILAAEGVYPPTFAVQTQGRKASIAVLHRPARGDEPPVQAVHGPGRVQEKALWQEPLEKEGDAADLGRRHGPVRGFDGPTGASHLEAG